MAVELYIVAAILIGGAALAKIAEQYKFPYPIFLIVAGLALGTVIEGEDLLAGLGIDFIAQLTLTTVLFYAGLTMNLKELRLSVKSIALLATIGVLLTSLIAGVTIALFSATIGIGAALLIGAILSPTDPAALFSVLESGGVRVKRKLVSILEGEAVFNDATAIILVSTVFLAQVVPDLQNEWYIIAFQFTLSMGLGLAIGLGVAFIMGTILLSPVGDTNVSVLTATTPILAYGIGEIFAGAGVHPGALAAVFAGIFMANSKMLGLESLPQKSMRGVMKNVSFAFEIAVFILLGLMLDVEFLMLNLDLAVIGFVIAILVIFVARPASVFIVTSADRTMDWKERFFVSWAGVKGVATAALAAIAVATITSATGPSSDGVDFALLGQQINVIIFIVLMVSLILQGLTTPFLATRLKLIDEHDSATEITIQRNATRHALLHLVDQYTEGKVGSDLYTRLKKELEEEIFTLEDELRKIVTEKKARIQELNIRESILLNKLAFYETEYESGKLTDSGYEEQKQEIETEIEEISSNKRVIQKGKET